MTKPAQKTELEDENNDDLRFTDISITADTSPGGDVNGQDSTNGLNNNNNNNNNNFNNKEFDMFDVIKEADSISQEILDSMDKSLNGKSGYEQATPKSNSNNNVDASSTTLPPQSPKVEDVVQLHPIYSQTDEFNHPRVGPPLGKIPRNSYYFDVILEGCSTPSNFYVRSYRTSKLLEIMQQDMNDWYVKNYRQESLKMCNLMLNGFYVLKKDGKYFRVKIVPPFSKNGSQVMAELLDYGGFVQVEPTQLVPLNKAFLTLPTQAWKAKLQVPSWSSSIRWTPEECSLFRTDFEGKSLVALILGEEIAAFTSERLLGCVLVDTSGSKDVYIHLQFNENKIR